MRVRRIAISLVLAICVGSPAYAQALPGFDCAKVTTEAEKQVCSNKELAQLDAKLTQAYKNFMKTLDEHNQQRLKEKQKRWMDNRNKVSCLNGPVDKKVSCLRHVYETRIAKLKNWAEKKDWSFWVNDRLKGETFLSRNGEEYNISLWYGPDMFGMARGFVFPDYPEEKLVYYHDGSDNFSSGIMKQTEDEIIFYNLGYETNVETLKEFITDKERAKLVSKPVVKIETNLSNEHLLDKFKRNYPENYKIRYSENEKDIQTEGGFELCDKIAENIVKNNYEIVRPIIAFSDAELLAKYQLECPLEDFQKYKKDRDLSAPYFVFETPSKEIYMISGYRFKTDKKDAEFDPTDAWVTSYKATCGERVGMYSNDIRDAQVISIEGNYYVISALSMTYEIRTIVSKNLNDSQVKLITCRYRMINNNFNEGED